MSKRITWIFVLISIMALLGCDSKANTGEFDEWSGTPENSTLGMGMADFNNGFIYYTDCWNIYEYDSLTGKSVKYDIQKELQLSATEIGGPNYLNAVEDGVLFSIGYTFPMHKVTFDNQEVVVACETEEIISWTDSYLVGDFLYGKDNASLKKVNINTGKVEILAERVLQYCKEEGALYYVAESENDPDLMEVYCWKDEKKKAEKIEVGMNPITICEEDGKLYMAEFASYQLYSFDLKTKELEKIEGVNSLSYQVKGNRLFYGEFIQDENQDDVSMANVYYRDLKTGKDVLLKEEVQTIVCVFSENAILCFENDHVTGNPYLILLDGEKIEEIKLPLF